MRAQLSLICQQKAVSTRWTTMYNVLKRLPVSSFNSSQIAMRMYTLADKAISEDEFARAVTICTGRKLSPHLVHTVFQVIDCECGLACILYRVLQKDLSKVA